MLRDATDADCERMLVWRNHPDVRRASLTTHVIGAAEHRAWWSRSRSDPTRRVLIFEHDGRPAGVVMFADVDDGAGTASWGFYLDIAGLSARRQLLPAWLALEQDAVAYAFEDLKLERLGGATLAWNVQVLALHRRFGFREVRRYRELVDGVPQDVVWTERGRE
jgi:UDP-4-amino-4,6-dideoxy-N-acetyl-beta-L-altrosamine N-acetyltransferase